MQQVNKCYIILIWDLDVFNVDNIIFLMKFIMSYVSSKVLLSKHLDPRIIEIILHRNLNQEEIMYYLSHIDPIIYKSCIRLDEIYKSDSEKFKEFIDPEYD